MSPTTLWAASAWPGATTTTKSSKYANTFELPSSPRSCAPMESTAAAKPKEKNRGDNGHP